MTFKDYSVLVPYKRIKAAQSKDWFFICTNKYKNCTKTALAQIFGKIYPEIIVYRIYTIKSFKRSLIRFKCNTKCPF